MMIAALFDGEGAARTYPEGITSQSSGGRRTVFMFSGSGSSSRRDGRKVAGGNTPGKDHREDGTPAGVRESSHRARFPAPASGCISFCRNSGGVTPGYSPDHPCRDGKHATSRGTVFGSLGSPGAIFPLPPLCAFCASLWPKPPFPSLSPSEATV